MRYWYIIGQTSVLHSDHTQRRMRACRCLQLNNNAKLHHRDALTSSNSLAGVWSLGQSVTCVACDLVIRLVAMHGVVVALAAAAAA